MPIQFTLICCFFLLYDIELVFILPYISGLTFFDFKDFILFFLFFFLFLVSFFIDFQKHALD